MQPSRLEQWIAFVDEHAVVITLAYQPADAFVEISKGGRDRIFPANFEETTNLVSVAVKVRALTANLFVAVGSVEFERLLNNHG